MRLSQLIYNNPVYNYLNFSRKYAQFCYVYFLCQSLLPPDRSLDENARAEIGILNERRIAIQRKMGILNGNLSDACRKCNEAGGGCCHNYIEYYFTAIDYWIRKYSGNPIDGYGIIPDQHWYDFSFRRVRKVINALMPDYGADHKEGANNCAFYGIDGCKLKHEERPVKCLISTCGQVRRAMDMNTKLEYVKSIKELYWISRRMLDILKKEAGISRAYDPIAISLVF